MMTKRFSTARKVATAVVVAAVAGALAVAIVPTAAEATSKDSRIAPTFDPITDPVTTASARGSSAATTTTPLARIPIPAAIQVVASKPLDLPAGGRWTQIGGDGVAVASTRTQPSGRTTSPARSPRVTVQVLSKTQADKLGLSGLVVRLKPVSSLTSPNVAVSVPLSVLQRLYGSSFASSASWLVLNACRTTRCASSRTLATRRVPTEKSGAFPAAVATSLPASSPAATDMTATAMVATLAVPSAGVLVTPMTATVAANGGGDAAAVPTSPASMWTASPQTGDFTWSYPMRTPPPAAGPTPQLSINYDSNSVNGRVGSTNNQPSEVGEGFDLSADGYITRSYAPCSDTGTLQASGELCWSYDNAVLTLGGQTSELVNDGTTWRLSNDDNSKVERLSGTSTGCTNGSYNNECWKITTSDGTQYYFGRNELPGWTSGKPVTNSTWTVPVCGDTAHTCTGAGTPLAVSPLYTQAWRWNLDYIVDVHGNSEALYYTTETNLYAQNGSATTAVSYIRGGYLTRIDYGMRANHELDTDSTGLSTAPDQVTFTYTNRCETGITNEPSTACDALTTDVAVAQYWPDVPLVDDYCAAAPCTGKVAPTFWSAKQLTAIGTRYRSATAYTSVDSWSLQHTWPDPGDASTASMTLASITHTGLVGGSLTLPATTFSYTMFANRVAPPTGVVPLEKPRLTGITTETSAHIQINYLDTDCSGATPATPESDHKRCFPSYWTPPGASTPVLDWFRTILVASVIADPKTGGAIDLPDQTFYDYSLGTPAYRLDTSPLTRNGQRTWSVFAGYDKVRVEHGDPNSPAKLQTIVYTYLQGLDQDILDSTGTPRDHSVPVSFVPSGTLPTWVSVGGATVQITDSLWWAGDTLETQVYNGLGGALVSDTVSIPWASPTADRHAGAAHAEKVGTGGGTFTYTPTSLHTGQASSATRVPLSNGGTRTTETHNTFDALGRVTKAQNDGDTAAQGDDQCTVTTYTDNSVLNLLGFPSEVNSYAGTCASLPADPATATISDVRTSYDSQTWNTAPTKGAVTTTQRIKAYTGTTPDWSTPVTTRATYDTLGRVASSTNELGNVTNVTYVPADSGTGNVGNLTSTTTTNPLQRATTTATSPAWGAVTAKTDVVNSHVTTSTYDPLGRLQGVWAPDRPAATNPTPTTAYTYTVTGGAPVVVKTTTLTPTGGTQDSYQLYDGLMRLRQTQAPAESLSAYNAAAGSGGASVSDTIYDFAGHVVTTYPNYWITTAPSATLRIPTVWSNIAASTSTDYDGAGRTTAVVTNAYGVEKWRTSYTYPGADRVDMTPPDQGTATTTYTDAQGRTTALLDYHGDTVGDPNVPSGYDKTTYAYYPTGPMKTMTNPAGQQWSWTYDVLGRKIASDDPDAGTTTSSYDDAGELQSSTDANGTTLWYTYDKLGRKTQLNQDSPHGALLDSWSYDTVPGAVGLLASSTSYVGSTGDTADTAGTPGTAYTESVSSYDANGRPTSTSTALPAGVLYTNSPAYAYTTTATYNPDGSLATQTEPAIGGVPAETLTYTYTTLGRLHSLIGFRQYVGSIGWDPGTGLSTGQSRDNGTYYLTDTNTYDPATLRLSNVQSLSNGGGTTSTLAANIAYAYNESGALTSISNTPTNINDVQCFGYDDQQRLTQAWTPTSGSCTAPPASSALAGPAPYWMSYTYSADGNRTTSTQHALSANGTDTRSTYAYPAPNASQPHAVSSITRANAPAGTATWTTTDTTTYGYTADGQTSSAGTQTLTWTPQGQIATVTHGTNIQTRVYDADGNLLLQQDPVGGTTAYLGDIELHVNAGTSSVTGQRIYSANGHTVAVRNGSATLAWLDTDPQGTSELSVNYATGAVTRRYYDPFGNPRGPNPGPFWPEARRGFLNAPTDTTFTGYTHLAARDYDPVTGRFLSIDPLLDPSDPQSINGYAYADNNPVNNTDPSGQQLSPVECDAACEHNNAVAREKGQASSGGNYCAAHYCYRGEPPAPSPPPASKNSNSYAGPGSAGGDTIDGRDVGMPGHTYINIPEGDPRAPGQVQGSYVTCKTSCGNGLKNGAIAFGAVYAIGAGLAALGADIGSEIVAETGLSATDQAALDYASTSSKLDHIFAAKHNFDPLVQQFGSREAVVQQFLTGLKGLTPASGTFEEQIVVGGQKVIVRGAVVDGVTKIGTAFTP